MGFEDKRIAIVGGGLGGMAFANSALYAQLKNVHIYEAASQFTEVGAGVNITRNANRILDAMGVGPAMRAKSSNNPPSYMEYRHYRTGEFLGQIDEFGEPRSRQIHRAHLLDALKENVPDENISLGKRLSSLAWSAEAKCYVLSFLDGTTAEADIVVGCDGIKSVIRTAYFGLGDNPVYSGQMVYRGYVSYDDLTPETAALLRKTVNFRGLRKHVLTLPIGNDESATARVGIIGFMTEPLENWTSENWLSTAPVDDMHEHVKDWTGAVQEIVAGLRKGAVDGKILKQALYVREPTAQWHDVRHDCPGSGVILIGDSVHSTLPHQGIFTPAAHLCLESDANNAHYRPRRMPSDRVRLRAGTGAALLGRRVARVGAAVLPGPAETAHRPHHAVQLRDGQDGQCRYSGRAVGQQLQPGHRARAHAVGDGVRSDG